MLLQLYYHLLNGFHVLFFFVFCIDEDVIKVHYYKNVELLYSDLIDIALEDGQCISQFKSHYLVFEMAIMAFESCFPFITSFDLHAIVGVDQIKLDETSSPT